MLIQTNGDSISYRIISHNSRTPIVAQATTAKKITESHLDTSHIPVKSAGALLHAWGKAQTAALAVGSQKKKPLVLRQTSIKNATLMDLLLLVLRRTRRKLPGWRRRGA